MLHIETDNAQKREKKKGCKGFSKKADYSDPTVESQCMYGYNTTDACTIRFSIINTSLTQDLQPLSKHVLIT